MGLKAATPMATSKSINNQSILGIINEKVETLNLPAASTEVFPGIKWGRFDDLFSPAYWATQAWLDTGTKKYSNYRLGRTLEEEITACLLGGYGIPSEVGMAAFQNIKDKGLISKYPSKEDEISQQLRAPVLVKGKSTYYRFYNQKAKFLSSALNILHQENPASHCHVAFRNWLKEHLPGIGWKTASWVTRNFLDSDHVAILDIHICRAGQLIGLYDKNDSVEKDYLSMEKKFINFANAIGVRPAILDTLIWRQMKDTGHLAYPTKTPAKKSTSQLPLF